MCTNIEKILGNVEKSDAKWKNAWKKGEMQKKRRENGKGGKNKYYGKKLPK